MEQGTKADYVRDGSPEAVAIVRQARGLPPLSADYDRTIPGTLYEAIALRGGDEQHVATLAVGRAEHPIDELLPACGIPNPSNMILCDLEATSDGRPHFLGQHLGWNRKSNLHGWKDTREDRSTRVTASALYLCEPCRKGEHWRCAEPGTCECTEPVGTPIAPEVSQ